MIKKQIIYVQVQSKILAEENFLIRIRSVLKACKQTMTS